MKQISPVGYAHQLAMLVSVVKSNTEEGNIVMSVLQEGDEGRIREMLMNFGNPTSIEWQHFTMAEPWTEFQINAAVEDLDSMAPTEQFSAVEGLNFAAPPEQISAKYWAW